LPSTPSRKIRSTGKQVPISDVLPAASASAKTCWDEALDRAGRAFGKDSGDFKRLLRNVGDPARRRRDPADQAQK
jgi:hypothetical protein